MSARTAVPSLALAACLASQEPDQAAMVALLQDLVDWAARGRLEGLDALVARAQALVGPSP